LTHYRERRDPANAVLSAHEQLKSSVRDVTRLPKLFCEFGSSVFKNCSRRPRGACDIGSCIRRQVLRLDCYCASTILKTALQHECGRESTDAAAEYSKTRWSNWLVRDEKISRQI